MPQVPFPHVLTEPFHKNNNFMRIVSDKKIETGYEIQFNRFFNDAAVLLTYRVDSVKNVRKPKGDWTNWKTHPFYHECDMSILSYIGTPKKSKEIKRVTYSEQSNSIQVEFIGDVSVIHVNVPKEIYMSLMNDDKPEDFYHSKIKYHFKQQ